MTEEWLKIFTGILQLLFRARRKIATAAIVWLAAMLAFHAIFGANGLIVYQKKREEYRMLQQENESLRQQNERLAQQVHALKTDPKAIEKEAREQLRYARPGEVVYTLPPPPSTASPANAQNHPNH